MSESGITVDDADALSSLRALTNAAPALLADATEQAATITIDLARPTVPRRSGRAASSLQAYATGERAVAGGGAGVDYYRWLELGGAAGRGHAVVRARSSGRYLKPAGERAEAEVRKAMAGALEDACRAAGLDLT